MIVQVVIGTYVKKQISHDFAYQTSGTEIPGFSTGLAHLTLLPTNLESLQVPGFTKEKTLKLKP